MGQLVPLGYISIADLFQRIGEQLFGNDWDVDAINFHDNVRKPAAALSSYRASLIDPVDKAAVFERVSSFLEKPLDISGVKRLSQDLVDFKKSDSIRLYEAALERSKTPRPGSGFRIPMMKAPNFETPQQAAIDEKMFHLFMQGLFYSHIEQGIRQLLGANHITAFIISDSTGRMLGIEPRFWLSEKPCYTLAISQGKYTSYYTSPNPMNDKMTMTNAINYKGLLVLKAADVEQLFVSLFPEKTKHKSKGVGGRKQKFDWDVIHIEISKRLRGILYAEDLPLQDSLSREIEMWCDENFEESPATSTIKGKLKKIYESFDPKPDDEKVSA